MGIFLPRLSANGAGRESEHHATPTGGGPGDKMQKTD
jgi:hypothetical protein